MWSQTDHTQKQTGITFHHHTQLFNCFIHCFKERMESWLLHSILFLFSVDFLVTPRLLHHVDWTLRSIHTLCHHQTLPQWGEMHFPTFLLLNITLADLLPSQFLPNFGIFKWYNTFTLDSSSRWQSNSSLVHIISTSRKLEHSVMFWSINDLVKPLQLIRNWYIHNSGTKLIGATWIKDSLY